MGWGPHSVSCGFALAQGTKPGKRGEQVSPQKKRQPRVQRPGNMKAHTYPGSDNVISGVAGGSVKPNGWKDPAGERMDTRLSH